MKPCLKGKSRVHSSFFVLQTAPQTGLIWLIAVMGLEQIVTSKAVLKRGHYILKISTGREHTSHCPFAGNPKLNIWLKRPLLDVFHFEMSPLWV